MQAQAAEAVRDYARAAERSTSELMKLVPGEILPKQALADIYRDTGRYAQAADLYHRVVAADPANADAVLGWADSLVALNQTDQAISVLDAVNENALRYVDAQLRLIELYLMRIDAYLSQQGAALGRGNPRRPACPRCCTTWPGRPRPGRSQRPHRVAPLLPAAGRLVVRRLPAGPRQAPAGQHRVARRPAVPCRPARAKSGRRAARPTGATCSRAPDAPDREDILARIYFDVAEWQ